MRPLQPFELKIIASGSEHALEHRTTLIKQILPGFAIFDTFFCSQRLFSQSKASLRNLAAV